MHENPAAPGRPGRVQSTEGGPRPATLKGQRTLDAERLAGLLLVGGSSCFFVGALNPSLFSVWRASPELQLRLIADRTTAWTITNVLFLIATVLTTAGLWLTPDFVGGAGVAVARAATVGYLLGASTWLTSHVIRLVITPQAASAVVTAGAVDPTYAGLLRLGGGLFATFTLTAGASLIAIGLAIIVGGELPVFAGWFAAAVGGIIVVGFLAAGDMPPFVAYLPTALIGILLLLVRT